VRLGTYGYNVLQKKSVGWDGLGTFRVVAPSAAEASRSGGTLQRHTSSQESVLNRRFETTRVPSVSGTIFMSSSLFRGPPSASMDFGSMLARFLRSSNLQNKTTSKQQQRTLSTPKHAPEFLFALRS
jgi:hypothetical protein